MALTEKIELLGAGIYKDIPDTLTLKYLPTASELDYVGSEDFDRTMLDKILPQSVEESINFHNLLEIDYDWICRCLRLLNYGPYHTTSSVFCHHCGISYGDFQVNLMTCGCEPLPDGFNNDILISKDEFLDFHEDIHFHLLTIQQRMNAYDDKMFENNSNTDSVTQLARICYMVSSIGSRNDLLPFEVKMRIQNEMSPADYIILKSLVRERSNYGLRAGGTTRCPKCGRNDASFLALVDDRYFRPTVEDLRRWGDDRTERGDKDVHGATTATV